MYSIQVTVFYIGNNKVKMQFIGLVNASIDVPIHFQSALIGAGGERIEGLKKQSGCKIKVCILINCNKIIRT